MGLKYTSSFDSIRTNSTYVVNIYQDSYEDSPINFVLAGTPVIQEWQEDDPLAPIKGSTLTINLTTVNGIFLLDFYSNNDNEFKVELLGDDVTGTQITLFEGYIQQDDCSEIQIDFVHTITLTATDNLGTIKDITLDRANLLFGDVITLIDVPCVFLPDGPFIIIDVPSWVVQPGQTFTIGEYTFTMVTNLGDIDLTYDGWSIQVVEEVPDIGIDNFTITYREAIALDTYVPLITFIKLCLRSTYLDLPLSVINHITPADGVIFLDTGETRMLEDVTLLGNTFLNGTEYMSCYDVLEIIMKRFNMSCFQSLNSWWVVRYPDLFLDYQEGETLVDYYKYEPTTFAFVDKFNINKSFVIATGGYVETGLLKSIIRPYRRILETFNYVQPENLLCNSNLTDLGPLVTSYSSGGNLINEYAVPCWNALFGGNFFIRQVINADGQEIDRLVYTVSLSAGLSNPIQVSKDDLIEFTFRFRNNLSNPGFYTITWSEGLKITDGIDTYYLKNDGSWSTTPDFDNLTYLIETGDNVNQFHDITWKSKKIPIDSLLYIRLSTGTILVTPGLEGIYKDMVFKVSYQIAGQGLVNGHLHTSSQSKKLNNINDVEIFIDNSERSTFSGTLFLTSQTGILQDRCTTWKFGYGYNTGIPGEIYNNLGQLITSTYMFQRYIPRTKFNGNFLYLRNLNGVMSNLAIFSNEFNGALVHNKMLLGSLSIDYKNDSAEFTLWEVFNKEIPVPADNFTDFNSYLFNILYQFNYLYENN